MKHQIDERIVEWIRIILFFLDMINRIVRIFSACGEGPFGRRPYYPNDPVDPVQFFFRNPFLFFFKNL